jgi:phage FluMu protein Com
MRKSVCRSKFPALSLPIFLALGSTAIAEPLPKLTLAVQETTVSGLSSGAFMSVQLQTAFLQQHLRCRHCRRWALWLRRCPVLVECVRLLSRAEGSRGLHGQCPVSTRPGRVPGRHAGEFRKHRSDCPALPMIVFICFTVMPMRRCMARRWTPCGKSTRISMCRQKAFAMLMMSMRGMDF